MIIGAGVGHITGGIIGIDGRGIHGGALGVRVGAEDIGLGTLGGDRGILGTRAGMDLVGMDVAGTDPVGTGICVMCLSEDSVKAITAEAWQGMSEVWGWSVHAPDLPDP